MEKALKTSHKKKREVVVIKTDWRKYLKEGIRFRYNSNHVAQKKGNSRANGHYEINRKKKKSSNIDPETKTTQILF